MNTQYIGQLAAVATTLCWAVAALSFEAAGKRVGSLPVNLIRMVLAMAFFAVYAVATSGRLLPLDAGAHVWIWLTLSGLVGFVIGDLFLFQAFIDVGARIAMLVYASTPVLTALLDWVALGQQLTSIQIGAMLLTVFGIILVTTTLKKKPAPGAKAFGADKPGANVPEGHAPRPIAPPPARVHAHPVRGAWFAFLGAVGQAAGLVLGRYGAPTYDAVAATQIRVLAGIVGFAVLFTVNGRWATVPPALRDRRAMRLMLQGAFFGPFIGVTLSLFAAQRAGAGIASTIIATVPVLLIPATMLLYNERASAREVVGAFIAVGGVALLFL